MKVSRRSLLTIRRGFVKRKSWRGEGNRENLALGRVPDDRQLRGPRLTNRWRWSRGSLFLSLCLSLTFATSSQESAPAPLLIFHTVYGPLSGSARSFGPPRLLPPSFFFPSSLSRVSSCSSFFLAFPPPPCVIHVDLGGLSLKFLITITLDTTGVELQKTHCKSNVTNGLLTSHESNESH